MATVGTHHLSSSTMASSTPSRLSMMQARLREQLMVEKESRLLEMAARQAAQQEGTIQRVTRSSSSSLNSSLSSISSSGGQGRVRKMFEERRQNGYSSSPVGRDKSYPLDPVGRSTGGGGGGGARPQVKGVVRSNRGVSMDRGNYAHSTNEAMKRSKSHAALPRPAQHADPVRSPARGLRPPQARTAPQYKSTSSLLDANQNYSRNNSSYSSRDPSPSPNGGAPSSSSSNRANRFGFRATSRGPSPAPSPDGHSSPGRGVPPTGPKRTNTFTHSRSNNSLLQPDSPGEYYSSSTSPTTPEPPTPRRGAPAYRPPQRNNRLVQENREEMRRAQMERRKEAAAAERVTQSRSQEEPQRRPVPQTRPQAPPKPAVPERPPRLAKSKGAPPVKSRGPSLPRQSNNNNNYDESDSPIPKTVSNKPPFGGHAKEETAPPPRRPLAASNPPNGLVSCKVCGRNFAPDRIDKHTTICSKSHAKAKKRKKFDPVKMRTKGTEAEKFVSKGQHLKEAPKPKKSDWRKKHEDFIATVRAAKGVKGYEAPPMDTSDYVQCPHCGRKFSEGVADRHIPKCASIQSNKPAAGRRR